MNFIEQLQQLDLKDIGRWPFLFRALGILVVLIVVSVLLIWNFVLSERGNLPQLRAALEDPSTISWWLIAAVAVVFAGFVWAVRRWFARRSAR